MTDVPRAAGFYKAVLDWECPSVAQGTPSPLTPAKSAHPFRRGLLNGAFLLVDQVPSVADSSNPGRTGPVATFGVANIDDTLAKVQKAGGKVFLYVARSR